MPWEELKTGPSPAEKTLLLDYISPIPPIGLWIAIKNRHWAVVLSIVGQLLILGTVRILLLIAHNFPARLLTFC
jgi:hypothetical protein